MTPEAKTLRKALRDLGYKDVGADSTRDRHGRVQADAVLFDLTADKVAAIHWTLDNVSIYTKPTAEPTHTWSLKTKTIHLVSYPARLREPAPTPGKYWNTKS